jgi:predicted phage terminase large subunit-like protein
VCEASGLDHDTVVELCKSSPYWVGRLIIGYDWFNNDFHRTLGEWFTRKYNEGAKRFLIMTPRDHLKTSMFGISTLVWRALVAPEDRVLYVMANCTESEKTLYVVREIFRTSDKIQHFFPDRSLDPKNPLHTDRQSFMGLSRDGVYREGTTEARGIGSRMTGGHFNWHIFDDLIDEEMVDSATTQQKVIDFVKRSDALFVRPAEDFEIVIGTFWPGPFYKWLIKDSGLIDTYETAIIGCYVDDRYRDLLSEIGKETTQVDGDPLWPEHFPHEVLDRIKLRAGSFDFAHQWLNIMTAEEDRRFKEEDFQYYNVSTCGDKLHYHINGNPHVSYIKEMFLSMTVDPATGEGDRTDESAITVCASDQETGAIFLLEARHGRWLPSDLIRNIIECAKNWPTLAVISPEDVSFQKTLKHFLKPALWRNGVRVRIDAVKPGSKKSKGTRIFDALQPFVENHQFYVLHKHKANVVHELVNMQVADGKVVGKSPNLADSLAYHAKHWRIGWDTQTEDEEDGDIPYIDPFAIIDEGPRYGLQCLT